MDVAARKNVDRINKISIANGKEANHNLDNIANKFTYIKDRINIILVNEKLGY